ncbi:hypothetical protein BGZ83_010637 [Gryganskiella cystojenkinii]|nr:hypothetical protein BGZ83_010637 [Gryganskiella cystojenkinii]
MTPAVPPEVAYDVQNIHSALESTVPDEQALVNIIGRRENQQLLVIARQYRVSYGVDLPSELDRRIIGSVGSLLAHACQHKVLAEVSYIQTAGRTNRTYESLRKKDTPVQVFCEMLLGRTPVELRELQEAFTAVHKSDLKQHVASHSPDEIVKNFFLTVLQDREDKPLEDKEGAIEKFHTLLQAQDVNALLTYVANSTTAQLHDLVRSYNAHYLNNHVVSTIQKTFKHKGEHVEILLFAVMQAADPARHVSLLLEESMAGLGTNEDQLSRLVIRNRGKVMDKVKAAYHVDYGRTLADRVRGDTSGLYSHLVCHLINQTI